MAKHVEKNKLNIPMCIAMIILCLTLITTHFTSDLYAKYVSTVTGDDAARVAKFSITENCTSFSTELEIPIEPGEITKLIEVKNDSEVAVTYELKITNVTDNIPLQFVFDNETVTGDITASGNVAAGGTGTHTIKIIWPFEGAENYIGKVDLVTMTLTAEQID